MRDFGPDWGSLKRWGWFTQLPKAFKNPNWKSSKESQIGSRSDPHVLQPKQSGRPKIPKNPPFRSKFWNLPSPRATAKNCETKSVWMIHCVTSRNLQLHGQTSKDTNRHVKIIFFFFFKVCCRNCWLLNFGDWWWMTWQRWRRWRRWWRRCQMMAATVSLVSHTALGSLFDHHCWAIKAPPLPDCTTKANQKPWNEQRPSQNPLRWIIRQQMNRWVNRKPTVTLPLAQ